MFESPEQLDPATRAAYLARLGVDPEPPSARALRLLVRRHAEHVPYETLWIPAGERWSTDPLEAAERIARHGRGGYCYHLNGALGLLLSSLGYTVHGHVGGVRAGDPEAASAANVRGNHLALTASGLPTDTNPAGHWYVDPGLGDALYEPLPLVPGEYDQAPFHLVLEQVDTHDGESAWTLTHDPAGGFRSMTWTTGEAVASDFAAQHEWLSTSPDSGFVRVPMAERRDLDGADVIRGLVLSRVGAGAFTGEPITRRSAWFEALADVFGLRFEASEPGYREHLWQAVNEAHQAWDAARV